MLSPFESLESRRLLTAYTEVLAEGATPQALGHADAVLNQHLASNGFSDLEGLLATLGSPSDFTDKLNANRVGGKPSVGGESPGFDPSGTAAQTHVMPRTVQSPDDRTRVLDPSVYPYSAVGLVGTGCSGAMISPFHYLTAGHCVTSGSSIVPLSNLGVSLGQDGLSKPFGTANAVGVRVYDSWRFGAAWEDDWAVITLDRSVGNFAGHFGYRQYAGVNDLNGKQVTILQYPGDQPFGTQWSASGPISYATDTKIYYNDKLDTAGGSSGSSIWEWLPGDATPMVLGVHGYGGASANGGFNSGARIDAEKFNDLNNWIAADYANAAPIERPDLVDHDDQLNANTAALSTYLAARGGELTVDFQLRNVGTLATGAFSVGIYASTNTTITSSDILLGTVLVPAGIDPYQSASLQWSGNLPTSLPVGNYSIGWIADAGSQVTEYSESNNTGYADRELTVATVAPTAPDRFEANESQATATDLGALGSRTEADLTIHNADDADFFKFTAQASGQVRVDVLFTHSTGDLDARLLNASGGIIASGISGTSNETLTANVVAGQTYYVQVYGYNDAINFYNLQIVAPADTIAPTFVSAVFDFEQSQSIDLSFSEPVAASLNASDFELRNVTTGQVITAPMSISGNRLTWPARLPDGDYVLSIRRAGITDAAGNALASDATFSFFVLMGDLDRDRDVDLFDAARLERNFGRVDNPLFSAGDLDYDGDVDLFDAALLERNFGKTLNTPALVTPPFSRTSLFAPPSAASITRLRDLL